MFRETFEKSIYRLFINLFKLDSKLSAKVNKTVERKRMNEHKMARKNISEEILAVLDEEPYERTVRQIADALGLGTTQVHYTIQALVDIGKIILTRKSGNAQMYKKDPS